MNTIGIPGQPSPVSSFDDNRTSEPAANMRLPETLAATPEGGRGPRVMTGFGGETTAPPIQETVTAVTWNVESGGADPRVLARQAATLAERGVDVMGLQEVDSQSWLDQMSGEMTGAAGQSFGSVLGTTGGNPGASRGNDFLGVVYNQDTLELKGTEELNDINRDGRGRAPLVAHFEHKDTGQEFLFVVNHLRRGSGARREDEAQDLNDWAQKQDLPVLNVGDFNWDYDLNTGAPEPDNRAMDYLTEDGVHNWVEPENKTQTYKSTRYNSILDGILTAGDAQNWGVAESRILSEAPFDGPNDKKNADHIPVLATFVLNPDANFTPPGGGDNGTIGGGIGDVVPTPTPVDQGLRIASALPNPAGGDAGNELVTLRNDSQTPIDLADWKVRDRTGSTYELEGGTIEPGAEFTINLPDGVVPLGNRGDEISLVNPEGEVVHRVSYDGSEAQSGREIDF